MPPRSTSDRYKPILLKFMSYRDQQDYPKDKQFTVDELRHVTPDEIFQYIKFQTYHGNIDADINQARPTGCRCNTLEF